MRVKKYLTVFNNYGHPLYTIRWKNIYIASRQDKEEILKIYDECVEADWEKEKLLEIREKYKVFRPRDHKLKYICKNVSNKYVVTKDRKYFCCTDTVEEAMKFRDLLMENDWDKSILPERVARRRKGKTGLPKYIRKSKYGKYCIQKNKQTWGTFSTLEAAVEERDLLIKHNWDYDFVDLY